MDAIAAAGERDDDERTIDGANDGAIDGALERWRRHDARLLSLMHVGADGWLKTLDFAPRDQGHVRTILRRGERADGSSLFRGTGIDAAASDVLLHPRPETAFVDPFATTPTLAVLCGHRGTGGAPLPQSPDTIVRRAAARLREETGHDLHAHGEVEFFLGKTAGEADVYGEDDRGYHAASPFVFGEALRRRALVALADMGVPVKYGHSEVGYIEPADAGGVIWEQHEIELDLMPLAAAADAIVLTQWVLRNLARQLGMLCSTAPMVLPGHPGNGLHLHLSPRRDGQALAVTTGGVIAEPARWLIGGLVTLGGALMAFGNRSPDSFARLRAGAEAPRRLDWGECDRSALVRLPAVPVDDQGSAAVTPTVEFRLPDGSAHPHLVLAGVAQAMVDGRRRPGLDELLTATKSGAAAGTRPSGTLPATPAAVADALAEHRAVLEAGGVFLASSLERLIATLRDEDRAHDEP